MKRVFVDTNVFLRFFSRDDAGQFRDAATLFRDAAAGKLELIAGPPVLFELAWTLRSTYRQPREKVLEVLSAIHALPGLRLLDASTVEKALVVARRTGSEFADSYIHASALENGADTIATFNRRHFKRFETPLHWETTSGGE